MQNASGAFQSFSLVNIFVMSCSPGTADHPDVRDLLCRCFPTVAKWRFAVVCTELRSSLTDWNYFLKRLEDWFLLPKLSDVLQFVDDFEVIRITGVTCKCGWGFMNSKFVDETSCLNYGKFSRRVEINSSTFFCLPSTFFTWQLKLPKEAELDWQDSSGDCCFHSLLPYVQRQHLEVLKEEQVSVLYFFGCGSEKFSVSDWAMKLQCNYFKNQGDHM